MHRDKKNSLKCQVSSVKADSPICPASHFKPRTSHSRPGGFTFIEMLATIVLIAIIMPVALHGIGLCTRLAGQSRREVEAVSLAKTKLTDLAVAGDWQNGNQRGEFGTDWPGYEWTATVTSWIDTSVRQLDLTVSWQSAGRRCQVTLSTLVHPEEGS